MTRDNDPAPLLPPPDADGNYLYQDGSMIWRYGRHWLAARPSKNKIAGRFITPEDAALALAEFGEGPAAQEQAKEVAHQPTDTKPTSHAAIIAELAAERQKRRKLAEALVGLLEVVTDTRQTGIHEAIKAAKDALAT